MDPLQGFTDLDGKREGFLGFELALLDEGLQGFALHMLAHQIELTCRGAAKVKDGGDGGMGQTGAAAEAVQQPGGGRFLGFRDDLNDHLAVQRRLPTDI